ncbi:MAG: hypothetical protein JWN93_2507 [Hyphomicrobiales bacterium]|nr:hypothetical protein [Hyphomicrobiales bacterium]
MPYRIEPNPEDDVALCSCCAGAAGVRGVVYEGARPVAVYFAEPAGMPKYPLLRLGLVVGAWTDDALPADRLSLAFSCRPGSPAPLLEHIDPYLATFPELAQLGLRCGAVEARGHADAPLFRAVAAAVLAGDERLAEMRGAAPRHRGFQADGA